MCAQGNRRESGLQTLCVCVCVCVWGGGGGEGGVQRASETLLPCPK